MAGDPTPGGHGRWSSGHFPYAQHNFNNTQPNPLRIEPPLGLLTAPPTVPAALRQSYPVHGPNHALHFAGHHPLPPQLLHHPARTVSVQRRSVSQQTAPPPYRPHLHPRSPETPSHAHISRPISPADDIINSVPPEVPQFGGLTMRIPPTPTPPAAPHNHPTQSEATNDDKLAKAQKFVKAFIDNFQLNEAALASFKSTCASYNQKQIDGTGLYVGIYRILHSNGFLHLLGGLWEFLPAKWQAADLTWLDKAIESDYQNKLEAANKENGQASKQGMPKKKRPVNGFKARHDPMASPPRNALVKLPVNLHNTATPSSSSDLPDASPLWSKSQQRRTGLVKLPITTAASPSTASKTQGSKRKSKVTPKQLIPAKRTADTTLDDSTRPPSFKGKSRYTDFNGADVPHVGPVYPTRRAVLSRPNRPYIHALCGQGFAHPQDVRSHERKAGGGVGCSAEGKEWNDHPSCKADYPQLNYAQVKDGYVILDHESFDKLEQAIAAGLQHYKMNKNAEMGKVKGKQASNDAAEGVHGNEEETEQEEDDMRAAALGLRKRSRR